MKIVDLSREMYHGSPTYPGHPPIIHGVWKSHEESFRESGNVHGLSSMFISMLDHAGTHIDAFRHFNKNGQPINEYPLEKCIVPGICIDLRHIAPRAEITASDLEQAVKLAGPRAERRHGAVMYRPSRAHVSAQGIFERKFRRQCRRHRMAGEPGRGAFRHRFDAAGARRQGQLAGSQGLW